MRVVRFTHLTGHSTLPQRHCRSCHNWYRVTGFTTGFTASYPLLQSNTPDPFFGDSLEVNWKTREGGLHPTGPRSSSHQRPSADFQKRKQPVVWVDTKKKELVGDFRNVGREWRPQGHPEEVRVHDFQDKTLGKAIPDGVDDMTSNEGWVSVGIDHDTAQFAAASTFAGGGRWGPPVSGVPTDLMIKADGGGSNGSRCRLWKVALQNFADETGLKLTVCHFPPGTSKWNKIEHRLFCHITQNWRGKPLVSRQTFVSLIAATTTTSGSTGKAALDTKTDDTGIKVRTNNSPRSN